VSTPLHESVLTALDGGQALFLRSIAEKVGGLESDVLAALWDLVWGGHLSNDTLAPLRGLLSGGSGTHRAKPPRPVPVPASRSAAARGAGRAGERRRALVPAARARPRPDQTRGGHRRPAAGAARRGDPRRGDGRGSSGGFAGVYPVLGRDGGAGLRRAAVTSSRGWARRSSRCPARSTACAAWPSGTDRTAVVLASTDPANPYGAALPWPERVVDELTTGHRPGRKAGALVVLTGGELPSTSSAAAARC
jgi:ATP-dependent Lhr-like helicase